MQIETKKLFCFLSIMVCFNFIFFVNPVWSVNGDSAHISETSGSSINISGSHHKKLEGSKGKHGNYSKKNKNHEGSKGRTWGRGQHKVHGHLPNHTEGSNGAKHSNHSGGGFGFKKHKGSQYGGHYAKGHREGSYSGKGYKQSTYKRHIGKNHVGNSYYSKDPFKHVLQFKQELGLTEAQVFEIKKQQFIYEKASIRSNAEHRIAHMDLDRVIHSENIDESKARQLAEKIVESKTQKIKAMVEGKLAVMRALNVDQKRVINRMYNRHN